MLTCCSAALRLPRCSAALRLPTLGYTVDSFAPAQLALRANLWLVYLAPAPALDCLSREPWRYRAGDLRFATVASVLRFAPVASLLRLPTLGYTFVSPFRSVRFRAGVLRCAMVASLLRLPSLGYTVDFPLGYALSRWCSLPVDFATLHPFRAAFGSLSHCDRLCRPSGCLRQATQPAPAGMCSLPRFHTILFPLALALAYYDNKTVAPPNGAKKW